MKASTDTWGVKAYILDNGDLVNGVDGAKRASKAAIWCLHRITIRVS